MVATVPTRLDNVRCYEKNDKHKRGASGDGPPRWFPSRDSLCPDDIDMILARELLDEAVDGRCAAHPDGRALFALHDGGFYKAYCSEVRQTPKGLEEVWHGYPVRRELVPTQIPARVLRTFVRRGKLSRHEYKTLLGSAR